MRQENSAGGIEQNSRLLRIFYVYGIQINLRELKGHGFMEKEWYF
jgi:hypothetical protein